VTSSAPVSCLTTFAASSSQLTAEFVPDLGSGVAGSTSDPVTITTTKDSTTTAVHVPSSVGTGANATVTATVTPTHAGFVVPGGSVQFFDGGQPIASCPGQQVSNGGATCTVNYQTPGSHNITASYSGDANFSPSGSASPQTLTVTPTPPSTTSIAAATDQPVTNEDVPLIATVTSSVAPVGTITFKNGGNPISGCTSKPVTTSGVPIICHTSFGASTAHLTASFTANPFAGVADSASTTDNLTISRDSSSVSFDVSNPTVNVGTSATYTATVTPTHGGPARPTGSVEFLDGGHAISSCLSQPVRRVGTFSLATCTVAYKKAGTHNIAARYGGDGNFTAAGSSPAQSVDVRTLSFQVLGTVTSTMQWTFFHTPRYTTVQALVMNRAPVGGTVLVQCHGRGCPFAKRSTVITKPKRCVPKGKHKCPVQHPGTMDLTSRFRNHRLAAGATVTVQISRPHWIGKYYIFAVRASRAPRIQIGCLAAGSTKPDKGC
jgi:Big-like domain-containing protein